MADTDVQQFGLIQIGNNLIAIPIEHLSEVLHVQNEQPLAQKGALLHGGISLRGRIIPVLDVAALTELGSHENRNKLGVIVEYKKRLVAVFADRIVGIATIKPDDIHHIANKNVSTHTIFTRLFSYEDSFASVLDVEAVFANPDTFTAERRDITKRGTIRTQEPVLTFEAGGAFYSVPAVEVYAAIPRQQIEKTAIAVGACLGEITYHGRRIPVVCPFTILGLGNRERPSKSEVVALRFPDGCVLGFAVDAIHTIGTFSAVNHATLPFWQGERNFIHKVIIRNDDEQVYAIDIEKLRTAKDLLTISELSKDNQPAAAEPKAEISQQKNVSREKRRYLVVDAVDRLAIPLGQVNRILEPPKSTTPASTATTGFCGYFSRFDESIALFDLAACRGQHAAQDTRYKILLTGHRGKQVGFLVEHVVSIEMSEWCEKPKQNAHRGTTTLVQLGNGKDAKVLPAFNLLEALDESAAEAISLPN